MQNKYFHITIDKENVFALFCATFIPAFLQKYKICNKLFAYTLIFATSFVCTNAYFRM